MKHLQEFFAIDTNYGKCSGNIHSLFSIIWTKYGVELKLCCTCTVLTRIKLVRWSIDAELGSTFEAEQFYYI